jgi:6-phosphogluconolactonase
VTEPGTHSILIGGYTDRHAGSGEPRGIQSAEFVGGDCTDATVIAELVNPSWLVAAVGGHRVYAVAETASFLEGAGGVAAYKRDPGTGSLTLLSSRSSEGADPAHLALDPSGRFLLVANYSGGSIAVLALGPDGSLGERVDLIQHQGAGADLERQAGPHPHQLVFDPVDGSLLVPDLGIDAVLSYRLDGRGRLTEDPGRRLLQRPGAGPRHLAFHPDGDHLFLVNELDNTLVTYRREGGGFVRLSAVSTLPPRFEGVSSAAAVRVGPAGRAVLVSNRGLDTLALFHFDPSDGSVTPGGSHPSGGAVPRDFVVSPDGRHVVVANQDSDSIVTFAFDEERLELTPLATSAATSPVCLLLLTDSVPTN